MRSRRSSKVFCPTSPSASGPRPTDQREGFPARRGAHGRLAVLQPNTLARGWHAAPSRPDSVRDSGVPRVPRTCTAEVSGHDDLAGTLGFYRAEHPQPVVAALTVVPDLEILEDRVRQLQPRPSPLTVRQLHLHPRPEGLDHRIFIAVADAAHRRHEAAGLGAVGERPGRELHPLVGVDQRAGRWTT